MARGPIARRPWLAFGLRACAIMVVLFAVRWAVLTGDPWAFGLRDAVFIIPAASLILASVEPMRRRLTHVGVVSVLHLLVDAIAILTGVQSRAESGGFTSDELGIVLLVALYHVWRVGLPVAALIVFVGDDPTGLWKKRKSSGRKGKR